MLYFSTSYLPNNYFKSLEELFKHISPNRLVLVYDTNIVIYFRDFYLNPKEFIFKPPYNSIKYLIENVWKYNLEVMATLGVEESTRAISDFSVLDEKRNQTEEALRFMLHLPPMSINDFILNKIPQPPFKDNGEPPNSMLKYLEQDFPYKEQLTLSYLASLKIIHLYSEVEKGLMTNSKAYIELYEFMRDEMDCVLGVFQFYSYLLFGGVTDFKKIIFPKKGGKNTGKKLQSILNGALDIVYPSISHFLSEYEYNEPVTNLTPVFVSTDRRLSVFYSLTFKRLVFQEENKSANKPELIMFDLDKHKTNWSNYDIKLFESIVLKDSSDRMIRKLSIEKQESNYKRLFDLIEIYESKLNLLL